MSWRTNIKGGKSEHQGMRVGDVITTYYKGFFILTRIEDRSSSSPLFYFKQVATGNGMPRKSGEKTCDAAYCQLAQISIEREIQELERTKNNLQKLLCSLNETKS